jgi:hypothetical protein
VDADVVETDGRFFLLLVDAEQLAALNVPIDVYRDRLPRSLGHLWVVVAPWEGSDISGDLERRSPKQRFTTALTARNFARAWVENSYDKLGNER